MRLFGNKLVSDTDRNQGNVLYTSDWKLWMIEFTRAFRISDEVRDLDELPRVNRVLFQRLRRLYTDVVADELSANLTRLEIEALLERRDRIIAHIEQQIGENGEDSILSLFYFRHLAVWGQRCSRWVDTAERPYPAQSGPVRGRKCRGSAPLGCIKVPSGASQSRIPAQGGMEDEISR